MSINDINVLLLRLTRRLMVPAALFIDLHGHIQPIHQLIVILAASRLPNQILDLHGCVFG